MPWIRVFELHPYKSNPRGVETRTVNINWYNLARTNQTPEGLKPLDEIRARLAIMGTNQTPEGLKLAVSTLNSLPAPVQIKPQRGWNSKITKSGWWRLQVQIKPQRGWNRTNRRPKTHY